MMPKLVFKHGRIECELYAGEYYLYVGPKLVRVLPSEGMAREVAAGYE
jgi:hypothetical protein